MRTASYLEFNWAYLIMIIWGEKMVLSKRWSEGLSWGEVLQNHQYCVSNAMNIYPYLKRDGDVAPLTHVQIAYSDPLQEVLCTSPNSVERVRIRSESDMLFANRVRTFKEVVHMYLEDDEWTFQFPQLTLRRTNVNSGFSEFRMLHRLNILRNIQEGLITDNEI